MVKFDKNSDEYIINKIESTINDLVRPKYDLKKCYDYYYGNRDNTAFRYLEENFGCGNATKIEFTPLIKNHIDFLVGQYMSQEPQIKISAKDKDTITKIGVEKNKAIDNAVNKYYLEELKKGVMAVNSGGKMNYVHNDKVIEEIERKASAQFVSSFEKAGQDIIDYANNSNDMQMHYKRQCMAYDCCIAGMCFSEPRKTRSGDNFTVNVYSPMNTFFDPCPESPDVRSCSRIVVRRWMTKYQIVSEYGGMLTDDDMNEIDEIFDEYDKNYANYIYVMPNQLIHAPNDFDGKRAVVPGYPNDKYSIGDDKLIPVYEVQWLDYDKNDGKDKTIPKKEYPYITYRYKGVRICNDLYIPIGKDPDVYDRTKDNPSECHLSINGVFVLDRNNQNYSMVKACMHLQDKYDVNVFKRDSMIAASGTIGTRVDMAQLPLMLGDDDEERLKKFLAYSKQGIKLYDSSMEVSNNTAAAANSAYSTYDESVNLNAVNAYKILLSSIEADISKITGVFGVALGEAREYQVGTAAKEMRVALHIAKRVFSYIDMACEGTYFSIINITKAVWRNGKSGSIVTGKSTKFFEVYPEQYTLTDYDIHVKDTTSSIEDMEKMEDTKKILIGQQALDPTLLPAVLESTSLTEMRDKIQEAVEKKVNYTNIIEQLTKQIEQQKEQIKELTEKNDNLSKEQQKYVMEKIKVDKDIARQKNELDWFRARSDAEYQRGKLEIEKQK